MKILRGIQWFFAIIFILTGVINLPQAVLSSVLFISFGVSLTPLLWNKLKEKRIIIKKWHKIIGISILFVAMIMATPSSSISEQSDLDSVYNAIDAEDIKIEQNELTEKSTSNITSTHNKNNSINIEKETLSEVTVEKHVVADDFNSNKSSISQSQEDSVVQDASTKNENNKNQEDVEQKLTQNTKETTSTSSELNSNESSNQDFSNDVALSNDDNLESSNTSINEAVNSQTDTTQESEEVTQPVVTQENTENISIEVHITKTGEKYHSAGCQYLRKSDYVITLEEALLRGYEPCCKCNPPM